MSSHLQISNLLLLTLLLLTALVDTWLSGYMGETTSVQRAACCYHTQNGALSTLKSIKSGHLNFVWWCKANKKTCRKTFRNDMVRSTLSAKWQKLLKGIPGILLWHFSYIYRRHLNFSSQFTGSPRPRALSKLAFTLLSPCLWWIDNRPNFPNSPGYPPLFLRVQRACEKSLPPFT